MPYFTIVFEGDIRGLDRNPMKIESPFGRPVASCIGNAFDDLVKIEEERDRAADEIERLRGCLDAIRAATVEGRICDDVAWFDTITTLFDFCDQSLNSSNGWPRQAIKSA